MHTNFFTVKRFLNALLGASVLALSAGVQAQPVIVSCDLLMQEKLYSKAFRCFQSKINQTLQHKKRLSKLQKIQAGLQVQQAVSAAKVLAKRAPSLEKRVYWLDQAIRIMQLSYQAKICARSYRCRQLLGTITELKQQIGYGRITVQLPPTMQAQMILKGYNTKRRSGLRKSRWVLKQLPPGPYILFVQTQQKQTKRCQFYLRPRQEQLVTCVPSPPQKNKSKPQKISPQPKPIRPPPPKVQRSGLAKTGWFVIGVGAAVAIAGSIFLAMGQDSLLQRDEKAQALKEAASSASPSDLSALAQIADQKRIPEVEALDQSGRIQIILGWTAGGVGVGLLATGVALLLQKASPPPQPQHKAKGSVHFGLYNN